MTTDTNSQASGNTQTTGGDAQPAAVAAAVPAAGASAPAAASSAAPAATSQQATEGQPAAPAAAAAASADGDEGKTDGEKPTGAPEKYEFKPPENRQFDPGVIEAYSTVAKELDLSQEAAQKILDTIAPKVAERYEARQLAAREHASTEWRAAAQSDKDFGGDKFTENLAVAKKALDAFGTPELRKLLEPFDREKNPMGTGLGDHPEFIRVFFNAGKAISEDKFVPGGKAPSKGETNAAKALYPNQPA